MNSQVDSKMTKPRTSKVYINDINEDVVLREIQNGLDFIQFKDIVDHNASVFIKPNLTAESHKPGITTTPLMIRAVVNAVAPYVGRVITVSYTHLTLPTN